MTNVTLRVIVHEGPRYFIKALVFEGNTIFRDSELAARLPLVVGRPCARPTWRRPPRR